MKNDPELTDAYRKDEEDERFLARLNEVLAPHEEQGYRDLPEIHPTIYVVGAPRSGTTLLTQLIAAHLDVGVINNLVAAFWEAPTYGIRLSRKLLPAAGGSSYQSDFGRTSGLHEPHEFGYFWAGLLGRRDLGQPDDEEAGNIDWERVRRVLVNMGHAYGKPLLFKAAHAAWHLARLKEIMPRSCFVRIRRRPLDNALSLIKFREQFLGSVEEWVSLKPREHEQLEGEPYWVQVAGQVHFVERAMDRELARIDGESVVELTHEELCLDPRGALEKVRVLIERSGATLDLVGEPPQGFDPGATRFDDHPDRERVAEALERFYPAEDIADE